MPGETFVSRLVVHSMRGPGMKSKAELVSLEESYFGTLPDVFDITIKMLIPEFELFFLARLLKRSIACNEKASLKG